jgi:hypothetical protein
VLGDEWCSHVDGGYTPPRFRRIGSANGIVLAACVLVSVLAGGFFWLVNAVPVEQENAPSTSVPALGERSAEFFPVTMIGEPKGPPRADAGIIDGQGNPVTVACSTCHMTREPNFENKAVADLKEFHGSLVFSHGTVSCLSCHNSTDYDALKLADGTRVEYTEVMTLCAQCHGPQMRDYEHGVHGGMTGYWDLTRGPRQKNSCVACHNPHQPQFPQMQPTFKPKDRFLEKH